MEMGIGQKVTNLGVKINKKIERSVNQSEERIMKTMQIIQEKNNNQLKEVKEDQKIMKEQMTQMTEG